MKINYICKKKNFFRFPPDPNGFLHIGHIYILIINFFLSLNKFSYFLLRFDNTNLLEKKNYFYKSIKYDILWLGIKWNNKINFFNNHILFFIKYLFFFLKKKKCYYKKKTEECIFFTNYIYKKKIYIFFIINNFYKKNQFSFFIKKKIIFRIKKYKKNLISSTYDFSQCLNDKLNKINLSICTNEFKNNSNLYNYILNKIFKKKFSYQIEFNKIKLKNIKLSKKKLKKINFNIFYLRKKKILPKIFFLIYNYLGTIKNNSTIKINYIKNFFYKKKFLYFYIITKKKILFNIIKNNKFFFIKKIKFNKKCIFLYKNLLIKI